MTEIFVALLDEGTDVWRPVQADVLPDGSFMIAQTDKPEDEIWEFEPGATVRCERRDLSGGSALVAVELVAPAI